MSGRHRWADVAIAFAEGKAIQYKHPDTNEWNDWQDTCFPCFVSLEMWRVKPAEPVVRWLWAHNASNKGIWYAGERFMTQDEAVKVYGDQQHICLDYTRTEFPPE